MEGGDDRRVVPVYNYSIPGFNESFWMTTKCWFCSLEQGSYYWRMGRKKKGEEKGKADKLEGFQTFQLYVLEVICSTSPRQSLLSCRLSSSSSLKENKNGTAEIRENKRTAELKEKIHGRDLRRSSSPSSLLKPVCLEQIVQDHILVSFEYSQRRRFHNFSEHPVSVLCHPPSEEVLQPRNLSSSLRNLAFGAFS